MKPKVLLIAPTALNFEGQPIKKRKLYLPSLTLLSLAAVTPDNVDLTLCNEVVHDIPFDGKMGFSWGYRDGIRSKACMANKRDV